MSRHKQPCSDASLYSITGPMTEIQIIATARGITLDVQGAGYDVTGHRRVGHATTFVDMQTAVRFETLLGDAVTAALMIENRRQTALWSPLTFTGACGSCNRSRP